MANRSLASGDGLAHTMDIVRAATPPDDRERPADADHVMFVDHSGPSPGGGQLGLMRFLRFPDRPPLTLVTFEDGPLTEIAREAGVPEMSFHARSGWLSTLRIGMPLRHAIITSRPRAVIANSLRAANLLAIIAPSSARRIVYVREDLSRGTLGVAKWALLQLFVLRRFDAIIANSRSTLRSIRLEILRRKPSMICHPISGISAPTPSDIRRRAQELSERSAAPIRLLWLGRLVEWKGVHILLEALSHLPTDEGGSLHVTIAGAGDASYTAELTRIASGLGVTVRFVGHIDAVDPLMDEHDVFIHSSVLPEAFGQVIPQAMSRGLAVVAAGHGGPCEIIDTDVNGILVPPNDPRALAATLSRLIRDPELRSRLALAAMKKATQFADERTAPELAKAINELVA